MSETRDLIGRLRERSRVIRDRLDFQQATINAGHKDAELYDDSASALELLEAENAEMREAISHFTSPLPAPPRGHKETSDMSEGLPAQLRTLAEDMYFPNMRDRDLVVGAADEIDRLSNKAEEMSRAHSASFWALDTISTALFDGEVDDYQELAQKTIAKITSAEAALARVTEERDALLPLAKASASLQHWECLDGHRANDGHVGESATCPHHDCALVRSLTKGQK